MDNLVHVQRESLTHLPVLDLLLRRRPHCLDVVEFGVGYGSTYLFQHHECFLLSVESDINWAKRFSHRVVDASYTLDYRPDLVFVDCHPSSRRVERLLEGLKWSNLVVVHDTEPASEAEYGWSAVQTPPGMLRIDVDTLPTWTTVFAADPHDILAIREWMAGTDEEKAWAEIDAIFRECVSTQYGKRA